MRSLSEATLPNKRLKIFDLDGLRRESKFIERHKFKLMKGKSGDYSAIL